MDIEKIDKIKKVSIYDWLLQHGYKQGNGRTGKYRSFYSPFNQESNASLKVNTARNTFHDYSSGKKGDIIDLVQGINNCSFLEACDILTDNKEISVQRFEPLTKELDGTKIHRESEVTDEELIHMMCDVRKVNYDVLMKYCVELDVSFPNGKYPDKIHTVVGMKNDMGGVDYRGKESWLKLSSFPKSFTTIQGQTKSNTVQVVEGFVDFLSYLTYYGVLVPEHKTYILNGLGMLNVLKPFISDKEIIYMCDNDTPANNALAEMEGMNVKDCRGLYAFSKDFNEFIVSLR